MDRLFHFSYPEWLSSVTEYFIGQTTGCSGVFAKGTIVYRFALLNSFSADRKTRVKKAVASGACKSAGMS